MIRSKRIVFVVMSALALLLGFGCGRKPEPQPEVEKAKVSRFNGFLGGASEQSIFGWAMNEKNVDEAVMVSIYDGDALLGAVKADVFRKDLRDTKIGTGNYGFAFPIPASLFDGKTHRIHAKVQGTSFELKNSPKELVFKAAKGP
jgi:hypothetical protein